MTEMTLEKRGVSERLLRELIKSPKFKASMKLFLANIDPETAKGLANALMWGDVEFFMGTVSAMPALVNFLVALGREITSQLNTFPPPMLIAFMSQMVQGLDFEAMREAVVEFKAVLDRLEPVVEELKEASSGVVAAAGMEDGGKAVAAGKPAGAGKPAAKKPAAKKPAAKKPAGASKAAAKKPAAKKPAAKKPAAKKTDGAGKPGAAEKE
jgi:hypothetical protein